MPEPALSPLNPLCHPRTRSFIVNATASSARAAAAAATRSAAECDERSGAERAKAGDWVRAAAGAHGNPWAHGLSGPALTASTDCCCLLLWEGEHMHPESQRRLGHKYPGCFFPALDQSTPQSMHALLALAGQWLLPGRQRRPRRASPAAAQCDRPPIYADRIYPPRGARREATEAEGLLGRGRAPLAREAQSLRGDQGPGRPLKAREGP